MPRNGGDDFSTWTVSTISGTADYVLGTSVSTPRHEHLCNACGRHVQSRAGDCTCGGLPESAEWRYMRCQDHRYVSNPIPPLEHVIKDKITAESLSGKGKLAIWRWKPRSNATRGGVSILLRSPDLEQVFRELTPTQYRESHLYLDELEEVIEAPPIYRCGLNANARFGGESGIYGSRGWIPVFDHAATWLYSRSMVNCMPLLAVGLSEGVKFKFEGVYTDKEIVGYGEALKVIMEKIYQQLAKAVKVTVKVTPGKGEGDVAA